MRNKILATLIVLPVGGGVAFYVLVVENKLDNLHLEHLHGKPVGSAIGHGLVDAVELNFFSGTVDVAAKLPALAAGYQLAMSKATYRAPRVSEYLASQEEEAAQALGVHGEGAAGPDPGASMDGVREIRCTRPCVIAIMEARSLHG